MNSLEVDLINRISLANAVIWSNTFSIEVVECSKNVCLNLRKEGKWLTVKSIAATTLLQRSENTLSVVLSDKKTIRSGNNVGSKKCVDEKHAYESMINT